MSIREHIININIRRLIFPICYMILLVIILFKMPFINSIFPTKITDIKEITELKSNTYVTYTSGTLYYTGYDHSTNGRMDGHYYYEILDDTCAFYLLKSTYKNAPETLKGVQITGKLVLSEKLYDDLINKVSQEFQWTTSGLSSISNGIVLSEVHHHPVTSFIIALILLSSITAVIIHFGILIYNIFNPYTAFTFVRLGNARKRSRLIHSAEQEFENNVLFVSDNMYITDNFFLHVSQTAMDIIPLSDIVWAYKHSNLHKFFGFGHNITYTLRIITKHKYVYEIPGKTKEASDALLDTISQMHPEILIGYSIENKKNFTA